MIRKVQRLFHVRSPLGRGSTFAFDRPGNSLLTHFSLTSHFFPAASESSQEMPDGPVP
ncbi:hypothetical protein ebA1363 [Aromatoleum aromaticum EbN1]|uniref:Uncharacterized protein n=1 Tax=Aromatoleum aromaticum (strain DSM 19018 / LMG 30748 / EbN1) TaxID=76114 RepID=Q5P748_AROAE|nr:hypothetical protein ebA1363 [Aromatoleum aromaticum EbN1]